MPAWVVAAAAAAAEFIGGVVTAIVGLSLGWLILIGVVILGVIVLIAVYI